MAVAECKITAFTGVSGIMIRETAETLGIITQDDKFRGNLFASWFIHGTTSNIYNSCRIC